MAMQLDEEVEELSVVLAPKPFISPTALGQKVESAKNGGQPLKEMIYVVCKV